MSKLREKFKQAVDSEQCEQITDDFTDKYIIWFNQNVYQMISYKGYYYKNELKTLQELRHIFKTQYYE